jgi:ATP-dependent DNA helicase RecG
LSFDKREAFMQINGNLFEQVEKTMDLLLTKYTKALISYEGLIRVETF